MATNEPPKCNSTYTYEEAKELDRVCQTYPTTEKNPPSWQYVNRPNTLVFFNQ